MSAVQTVASGRATSSAQNKNNKRNVIAQAARSALAKYNSGEKARSAHGSHHALAAVAGGVVMVVGTAAVVVAVVSTGGGDAPLAVPEEAGVDALAAATTAAIEGDAAVTGTVMAAGGGAQSAANGAKLGEQLEFEVANSAFNADGTLAQETIDNSKMIISPSELGNPQIPSGFGKFTTETIGSPSGDFQVHFYQEPITGAVDYSLDYKVLFNEGPK